MTLNVNVNFNVYNCNTITDITITIDIVIDSENIMANAITFFIVNVIVIRSEKSSYYRINEVPFPIFKFNNISITCRCEGQNNG